MHSFAVVAALLLGTAAVAAPPKKGSKPAGKPSAGKPATAAPKDNYKPLPVRTVNAPNWSVAFSPDGRSVAIGSYRKVVICDAATGVKRAEWAVPGEAVRAVAFSADGAYLAAGGGVPGGSGMIALLDTASGKIIRTISGHDDTVEAVSFAGGLLLSAADDEKVLVTEIATGKTVGVLGEHIGRCLSVAAPTRVSDADGGAIFATGGADKMLKIWDANLRRVVVNFDQCQSPVWALAALPRPGRFVAGSGDGAVRVFGVRADGRAPAPDQPAPRAGFVSQTLGSHDGAVYALAVSPDGNLVASGGADKKVIVWKSGGGKVRELTDATADIAGLAISPDNQTLAVASLDGHTRLYDLPTGALKATVPALPALTPQPPLPTSFLPKGDPSVPGTHLWVWERGSQTTVTVIAPPLPLGPVARNERKVFGRGGRGGEGGNV